MIEDDRGENIREEVSVGELFNPKYLRFTMRLIVIWLSICFISYGMTLLLPTILERVFKKSQVHSSYKYLFMMLTSVIEVVGYCISPTLSDNLLFGRKKTVYSSLLIIILCSILILFTGEYNLLPIMISLGIIKFMAFVVPNALSRQSSPTPLKSMRLRPEPRQLGFVR